MSANELSADEMARYARHLLLPEVQVEGQVRLKQGSVLVIGAGGLGSPVLFYLAAAGVGRIGIVDYDVVDASNLQRQILFTSADVGASKAKTAAARLRALNPLIQIEPIEERFSETNALDMLRRYDVVIDGSDNFSTRYLVNDACVMAGKPNVHGAIYRFEGQVSVFCHQGGPCYRCLFLDPPPPDAVPNCAEGGVLGIIAGTVGSLQATEAIKLLLGKSPSLAGKLLVYDAMNMQVDTMNVRRNPQCPVCGEKPTITELKEVSFACSTPVATIAAQELINRPSLPFLLDVRNPEEFALGHIDGAKHIPLSDLEGKLQQLNPQEETVVYCRSGKRSERAVEMLMKQGFKSVRSLEGGIIGWVAATGQQIPY